MAKVKLRKGVIALGLIATTAATQSPHRLVVVVGRPNDPRATQQHVALEHDAAALRERDVVVQDVTPEAARHERPELGVKSEAVFEVLLVGKDGEVKLAAIIHQLGAMRYHVATATTPLFRGVGSFGYHPEP